MSDIIKFLVLLGLAIGIFVWFTWHMIPDYSREGTKILINNKDTALIMNEEKPLPFFALRPRYITIQYKDGFGVYHEESFRESQITEIKPQE